MLDLAAQLASNPAVLILALGLATLLALSSDRHDAEREALRDRLERERADAHRRALAAMDRDI